MFVYVARMRVLRSSSQPKHKFAMRSEYIMCVNKNALENDYI